MEITNTGEVQNLSYLQKVNDKNKEEQEDRNIDNLVKAKEWQEDLNGIKALEADYNRIKIQDTVQASEDFLAVYGIGGTLDVKA